MSLTTSENDSISDNESTSKDELAFKLQVCEKKISLKTGDEVRCMDGENIRGTGKVYMVKNTNYFGYSEIWI